MNTLNWLDCKTGEPILNKKSETAYFLIPEEFGGGHYETLNYKGDGFFGEVNVFEKIVEWNAPTRATEDPIFNRLIGIDLSLGDERNAFLKYPIKITKDETLTYEEAGPSIRDVFDGKSKMPKEVRKFFENVEKKLFEYKKKDLYFAITLFDQNGNPSGSYEDTKSAKVSFFVDKNRTLLYDQITSDSASKELFEEEPEEDEEYTLD